MGWFWAATEVSEVPGKYAPRQGVEACPIDHSKLPDACPVKHKNGEIINPLNNMPSNLSLERIPGQKVTLSTVRTMLTIPKGEQDKEGVWEYPSPQQMLNAMYRKGKGEDIDETAVESMVDVHNFLNEGAWNQILEWEQPYTQQTKVEPRLLKFTGRPYDLLPRAQGYLWLGKALPSYFNQQPPFDRHDWTVLRLTGEDQQWQEVRYVIDYYSAPDDEDTGMPAFMLDTRPALDSVSAARDRFTKWWIPTYRKAMGQIPPQH